MHTKSLHGLGSILAAGGGDRTVYAFMADHRNHSACQGACTSIWPPVTTGRAAAKGNVCAHHLGTMSRGKRVRQLTCNGRPLYWFSGDHSPKQANGEGIESFGARWYVLSASGQLVKKRR